MDRVTIIGPLLLKYTQNRPGRIISGKSRIKRKLGTPFLRDMQKSGPERLLPRRSWKGKSGWIVKNTQKSTKRPRDVKADRLFTTGPKRVSSASALKSPAHRWRTYGI